MESEIANGLDAKIYPLLVGFWLPRSIEGSSPCRHPDVRAPDGARSIPWPARRIPNRTDEAGRHPDGEVGIFRTVIVGATPGRSYSWFWCRARLGTDAIHGISRTRRIAWARRGSFSF